MREDEYIDLDKINAEPKKDALPGFSKKGDKTTKKETKSKTKKTQKKKRTTNQVVKKSKTQKTKKTKSIIYYFLAVILIAILAISISLLTKETPQTKEDKILLMINGVPIMEEEVQTRADWIRLINGVPISDEQALELTVDIELLFQAAIENNITVEDEEIESLFQNRALTAGMTLQELEKSIMDLGINYELAKKIVKKETLAQRITEQRIETQTITDQEVLEYYEQNQHLFVHEEVTDIRHIYLLFKENQTENETRQQAENIKQKILEDRSNFCELVEEYTDDLNTINTCGKYLIEKQKYPEEDIFSTTSINMEVNELKIIRTTNGYHVLWKKETIPAGISDFEQVKSAIRDGLLMMKSEEIYFEFIEELREKAEIQEYLAPTQEETTEIDLGDIIEIITEPIEQEPQELLEELEELQEIEELQELEETQIIINETRKETTTKRTLNLAKCLTEKGAKMYDVYWSPHGKQQAEAFGEYFEHIIRIECDPQGTNPKTQECKETLKREYPTWPTWKINNQLYEGYTNLNRLATIANCQY